MTPLDYERHDVAFTSVHDPHSEQDAPDRRDGSVYELHEQLELAVHIALWTGRPLLLRGDPGTGKSSLAAFVARNLGWRYYEHTVTSATRARDLLWRYDTVRRLGDAQMKSLGVAAEYIDPGVLWWAFDRDSALRRGQPEGREIAPAVEPAPEMNAERSAAHAVVLIDEIDKAEPDVPNGLLVPLASMTFRVEETQTDIERPRRDVAASEMAQHLVVITTNEERELPPAFVRRCVVHRLEPPDADALARIAALHLVGPDRALGDDDGALCRALAARVIALRGQRGAARPPGTAEYLDAVRACRALAIRPPEDPAAAGSPAWQALEGATLRKDGTER